MITEQVRGLEKLSLQLIVFTIAVYITANFFNELQFQSAKKNKTNI